MTLTKTFRNAAFVLLFIESLLIFLPLTILGAAINWPASLDEPASVNLPLILQEATMVKLGYSIYMLYSVLIIPVAVVISRIVAGGNRHNTLLQIATGFAIGSAVLRVLGIIRWLIPMPILAQVYVDPASSEATRESVAVMYDILNAYAGSVGEVLGVGFFAALWVGVTSYVILRHGALPRWIGIYGILTAVALTAGLLEIVNIDAGAMLTINVSMLHFWWLFIALIVLFRPQLVSRLASQPVS
ncbi:MAG: DUF4386 domain-containing protein [Chloroflexota bacterium]